MSCKRMLLMTTAALLLVDVSWLLAAKMQNAKCKLTGTWECDAHGDAYCQRREKEEGGCVDINDCFNCVGGTPPNRLCFFQESEECDQTVKHICGIKQIGGRCSITFGFKFAENSCDCNSAQASGNCEFMRCIPQP